ncbi:MAG: deoxyribonuclease IV [Planctomycetota bacterium]
MYGSHLSIAGGMHKALLEAERLGLDTVQVFTKNQQQWRVKPLDPDAVTAWTVELDRLGWRGRVVSHASYLINLASPDDELWAKSIDLMTVEIERCEALGIRYLVHHPGAYTTSTAGDGISRIVKAYGEFFKRTRGFETVCCLENTVGSGSNLGRPFDELAALREGIVALTGDAGRVGFCFDTCHAHAGGYDLATRAGAENVLDAFDGMCGLEHLRVLHVNDSKAKLGSKRDLHAHIGEGTIARPPDGPSRPPLRGSGFAAFVNRAELSAVPKILETPKGDDAKGRPFDAMNLRRLKGMRDRDAG